MNDKEIRHPFSVGALAIVIAMTLVFGFFWIAFLERLAPFSSVNLWVLFPMAVQATLLLSLNTGLLLGALTSMLISPLIFSFGVLWRSTTVSTLLDNFLGQLELLIFIGIWIPALLALIIMQRLQELIRSRHGKPD